MTTTAEAQGRPDPEALIAKQRAAMAPLGFMDSVWRGPAWTLLPDGSKHEITQTERIGPFLCGAVKVHEGRGYEADGRVWFNVIGTTAFDTIENTFNMHSYAQGYAGSFVFTPKSDGYVWEIQAGREAIMRYTATVSGDSFVEVGDRVVAGQPPARIFEMHLKRVGDTDWPGGGRHRAEVSRIQTSAQDCRHNVDPRSGCPAQADPRSWLSSGILNQPITEREVR